MICETVKIKADNEQGFIIINKSDLNKEHTLYAEEVQEKKEEEVKKVVRRRKSSK